MTQKISKCGKLNFDDERVFFNKTHVFAMVVKNPVLPGHVIICPKVPVQRYGDLSTEQLFELSLSVQFITKVVGEGSTDKSCTISIQEGLGAGKNLDHLHVHIIPRTNDDKY